MSYIPNVREEYTASPFSGERKENPYYEGRLSAKQVPYKVGFDLCRESLENFFYNLDVYEEELSGVFDISNMDFDAFDDENITDEEIEGLTPETQFMMVLKDIIMNWIEMERNEFIVALLENEEDR